MIEQSEMKKRIALDSLNYSIATARVILDELEKGLVLSDSVKEKIDALYVAASSIVHDPELSEIFRTSWGNQ